MLEVTFFADLLCKPLMLKLPSLYNKEKKLGMVLFLRQNIT